MYDIHREGDGGIYNNLDELIYCKTLLLYGRFKNSNLESLTQKETTHICFSQTYIQYGT